MEMRGNEGDKVQRNRKYKKKDGVGQNEKMDIWEEKEQKILENSK
jgi:hypothetical protein